VCEINIIIETMKKIHYCIVKPEFASWSKRRALVRVLLFFLQNNISVHPILPHWAVVIS